MILNLIFIFIETSNDLAVIIKCMQKESRDNPLSGGKQSNGAQYAFYLLPAKTD